MGIGFLDQLAHQLRIGKSPSCRRAINRILEEIKNRLRERTIRHADGGGIRVEGICGERAVLPEA
jgi:hypothetical protein